MLNVIFVIDESKLANEKVFFQAIDKTAEFLLTQYTLTPLYITDSYKMPLVIGNFPNKAPSPKVLKRKKLVLVRDFGNGVFLFRREVNK